MLCERNEESLSIGLALELLATRFPKPDLRDSIRRMPVRSVDAAPDIAHDLSHLSFPLETWI